MDSQTENNDRLFRLLAIRTGSELTFEELLLADPKSLRPKSNFDFLKSLAPNTNYHFLNCFKVSNDGSSILYFPDKDISRLYKLENHDDVRIEVSALVGKNGSGKSTILEVLYLAIHNLSVDYSILLDEDRNRVDIPENYLRCQLYFQTAKEEIYRLNLKFEDQKAHVSFYKAKKTEKNKFNFDVDTCIPEFELKDFFYSIVVNYSVYGLNDSRMGMWVRHLFHKNDSYQAPIVINPMRSKGNYDINREEYLNRNRLIANSAINYSKGRQKTYLTDDQYLDELFFKIDKTKIEFLEELNVEIDKKAQKVFRPISDLIEKSGFNSTQQIVDITISKFYPNKTAKRVTYESEVHQYVVKKLYKIASIYEKYNKYLLEVPSKDWQTLVQVFDSTNFQEYLNNLKDDKSHVTFKLRQAINYLIIDPLSDDGPNEWTKLDSSRKRPYGWGGLPELTGVIYRISFNELARRISGKHDSIINCIPPGLFKVFINVKSDRSNKPSQLENMSSGELQLVNSLQSTLYHINNLDSYSEESDATKKIIYRNVLLVFDEIELYFHPEYQRKFIMTILKQLDQLELKLVKNIHILSITHSPFILSDIPRTNILKLDNGSPIEDDDQTLAGNIYELIKDSFFLTSSTGEYAIKVINDMLKEFNLVLDLKKQPKKNSVEIKRKVELLKSSGYIKIIEKIGDRVIRNKMLEMYDECVGASVSIKKKRIEEEIRRLNEKLKELS